MELLAMVENNWGKMCNVIVKIYFKIAKSNSTSWYMILHRLN